MCDMCGVWHEHGVYMYAHICMCTYTMLMFLHTLPQSWKKSSKKGWVVPEVGETGIEDGLDLAK